MSQVLFSILLLTSVPLWADFDTCHLLTLPTEEVDLSVIRPTQGGIGRRHLNKKREKLQKLAQNPDDMRDYLMRKPIPVAKVAPGIFYLLDHHHLSFALLLSGRSHVNAYIVEDWSKEDLSESAIHARLSERKWFNAFDHQGMPVAPGELPQRLLDLPDDPFRSLAASVRKKGGFAKVKNSPFFTEFRWANYFRERMEISDDWAASVELGIELAHSPEASDLPGYLP